LPGAAKAQCRAVSQEKMQMHALKRRARMHTCAPGKGFSGWIDGLHHFPRLMTRISGGFRVPGMACMNQPEMPHEISARGFPRQLA